MSTNLNRRDFLKFMGLSAAAGIGTVSCNNPGGNKKWRMKLSTSSIHFKQLPIEQACEQIARLGYEAVDIWSAHDGCPHLDDVNERLGPEGLKAVLKKNNLELCALSVYKGGYERYAKLLGGVGGGLVVRGSTRKCEPEELTARMREFFEKLKPLIELAKKYDSCLAIENHGGSLLSSVDSFKAFVDINTSPRVGIALAPYHLQTIKASVPKLIRICGSSLFFIYAWQHYPDSQQLPGIGPTDMTPWIKALADIRYSRYVNPFMHGHLETEIMAANLAKSRHYLEACYEKAVGTT